MENIKIWAGEVKGYRLLDSGKKEKLEEINGLPAQAGIKIMRREPRAWWKKSLSETEWNGAKKELEEVIEIFDNIKAKIILKESSKHIGIFPEQSSQWKYIAEKIKAEMETVDEVKVLNLFGYTGVASLIAASCGAKVTHVDASKQAVDWARENQKLSGLENAPIRWIVDDVVKFIKKEIKRGEHYDAIIMDPPSYGKGPKGEVWKIEDELPKLMEICREILSENPLFVIFNMYSTELSSISMANLLSDMMHGIEGEIGTGELVIKQDGSKRLLPMSIFALWEK
jgi:23S rRNA G2069 N7-methylase RlmK/C1962 C5-methylase RlmI